MDENQIKARMAQVLDLVRQDVGTIRTGRATPSLVEDIMVKAYGGLSAGEIRLRVMELASISTQDAMQDVKKSFESKEDFLKQDYIRDPQKNIETLIKEVVAKTGENCQLLV